MISRTFQLLICLYLKATLLLAVGYNQLGEPEFDVVHVYPSNSEPASEPEPNCTTDTAIIDKLLNGTGYNKFRIPNGLFILIISMMSIFRATRRGCCGGVLASSNHLH